MTISISLGWWLLPAIITVASYASALVLSARSASRTPRGGNYNFGSMWDAMLAVVLLLIATVISMAAWLAWVLIGGAA
ncbi:hypothetical protein V5F77_20550 [Xanthobacter sp. DSM 24535]|uniref:hypothetical protein n=1 Tax=Roseixanthobacter psychrophilus TaxID=3119917 RepID=UPI00372C8604